MDEKFRKHLKARLNHAKKRLKAIREEQGPTPTISHNYYGGWSAGYWESKVKTYQNLLAWDSDKDDDE